VTQGSHSPADFVGCPRMSPWLPLNENDAGVVLKVGLGSAAKEITEDIEGTPRPKRSAPTIGAYEFRAR
jgi:hypothetical protein